MRAQFIYEKFAQNSDPIDDLGIGTIISSKIGDIIKVKDQFSHVYLKFITSTPNDTYKFSNNNDITSGWLYPSNLVCIIINIKKYKETMSIIIQLKDSFQKDPFNKICIKGPYNLFLKYFEKVK